MASKRDSRRAPAARPGAPADEHREPARPSSDVPDPGKDACAAAAPSEQLSTTLGLARRIQRGDDSAWDRLDAKLRTWLTGRIACAPLPPGWVPEDLVQVVFLEVFRGLPRFEIRPDRSFRSWVLSILEHKRIDLWRKARTLRHGPPERALEGDRDSSAVNADPPAPGPGPSTNVRRQEMGDQLRAALAQMTERHREVLRLREEDGRSFAEIGQELGYAKEATVRSLYHRAREVRRDLLRGCCDPEFGRQIDRHLEHAEDDASD